MSYLTPKERDTLISTIEKHMSYEGNRGQEITLKIRIVPQSLSTDVKIGKVLKDGSVFGERSIIDWENYDF